MHKVFTIIIMISISIFLMINCNSSYSYDIKKEIISPDGKYKAIAFIKDCCTTTSFSPQVSIVKASKKLKNESGNVFICKSKFYF